MKTSNAEIIREYGPLPGIDAVHGLTYDGRQVWIAAGDRLCALDPASGDTGRTIDVPADAGTAFDGQHFYQIGAEVISKIDPATGQVVAEIPVPPGGGCSGLA